MAGLEVQIGADLKDFKNKIKEVERDIQELANEKAIQIKAGLDTKEITAQIKDAKRSLAELKTTLRDTGNSFQKDLAPKVANGSNALTQFGRIAQDAPFGIMGIGNNITATAESFGYLVKETGSAGGALKAVASSIMGAGGILLAISLVTSGLTYMSQKGITVSDVFNKMSGTFDQVRKDMQDLNVEAAKNAQAQISSVGAYVAAAKNINLSMSDRLIAVKKLQDEYPAYFGNLTKEEILNGNVAKTVRDVTAALIAKAKAAGLTDRIVKLAEEEERIQSSINNSIAAQFKQYRLTKKEAFDAAVILNKQLRGEIDLEAELTAGRANGLSKAEKTALAAYKYSQTLQGLGGELRKNMQDQDKLTNSLERQTAAQIKLDFTKEKAAKKTYETPQVSGIDNFLTPAGLKDLNTIETFNGKVGKFGEKLKGLPGEISVSMTGVVQAISEGTTEANKALDKFNTDMNSIIQNGIVETLSELSDAIGTAFATGGNVITAVGKSLLSTLGGVLSELGKMCITTGLGILAIQTSLKTLNPYVAIAAGAALVALGGAVKGSVKNLGGSAGGSASVSGGSGSSYSSGASYSSPASSGTSGGSSSFAGGTVVFEISGSSLIGVLNNTLDGNKRLGGAMGI